MPRPPRINVARITFHVVQRGNDRNRTFFDDEDFGSYLFLLRRISRRYATAVHAYVLMPNHVHLLMTSDRADGISVTMQQTSSSYARQVNQRYQRTGTLWEGRFRSSPVDSDYYCLACYRYIEMNPVRAGIVPRPEDYRWSSFRENTGKRASAFVEPHVSFVALGESPAARQAQYRAMFVDGLPRQTISEIRRCAVGGRPIGSDSFRQAVARQAGVSLGSGKRGRPFKEKPQSARPESQPK